MHYGALAFARAERIGIRVDLDYCEELSLKLTEEIDTLQQALEETKFYRHWKNSNHTVNINSNAQLAKFLYDTKKIKPARTTESGQGSTDEEALVALNIPELNDILKMRKLKKIRDTYLQSFVREQVNGVLRPSFNLHLVKTFRSSSDKPNFQNIPKRDEEAMKMTRRALYPRPGNQLMEVDFGGIEVRAAAWYHKDPAMLKYIHDPSKDMHADMAAQLYFVEDFDKKEPTLKHLRSAAKNGFVFPQFYGDYYKNCAIGLAESWGKLPDSGRFKPGQGVSVRDGFLADLMLANGIKNMEDYISYVQEVEKHFWGVRFRQYDKWKNQWWQKYQQTGKFTMLSGFECSGQMTRNQVINSPVQGVAFHCLLWCFIRLDNLFDFYKLKTRLIGQIHDAIVLDVYPPELPQLNKILPKVMTEELLDNYKFITTPMVIEADIGGIDESYADLKPYKFS